ncbi:MAG: 30S ribosomal protein S7 [Candidatus Kerfeldbacteria bacterium RIFCSPLOWO2_01_FULL_48_11]|uniref:Small ribosomal subunit protein uS7 n=1 Tax=Candidatus Kerfeldbacteria bacterium RIFCSPLOWO2_01_FULL_48_11 TaxID=1798543 RepID=A0A1G2B6P4_9BACT|nr:MAG: 30S ribosomal protein S7 [Parcubacteria group bacterium GW2011_GWA2_48_9]KKW13582.1 MAG: 30S ribosomal protein S7 [Parcubacteria group bacterium GW2011_GWC2_49_9]OGY84366.1 MAG: 30S ribosomal protein S7 [Candidatus Kerfeldbacteria bacterium RIFCSPLOWO2_01_FULL_48_11]HCM67830.1 30S ribosomal protein S7 [Candidatus Kerfeldbacteria bacterium]
MRGKQAPKRPLAPDWKFQSPVVTRLVNQIMKRGKKSIAEKIVYGAFDIILEKTKKDPMTVFEQALKNVSPMVEVKSRRIGGANYQIPVEVTSERKLALAFRWLIEAAKAKRGKSMKDKLALELMNAATGEGDAIKKREDVHRMAEANRAFAHFSR